MSCRNQITSLHKLDFLMDLRSGLQEVHERTTTALDMVTNACLTYTRTAALRLP